MNKRKSRWLAAAIAAFAIIAGTAAFMTSRDTVTNTFPAGKLQIQIIEPNWVPDPVIVPEQEVRKNPYIENTDTTSAYVFMEVTVPAAEVTLEVSAPDDDKGKVNATKTIPLFRFVSDNSYTSNPTGNQVIRAGWFPMSGYPVTNTNSAGKTVSYTYLYAYTGANTDDTMAVLTSGSRTTTPLFDSVRFCNAREDDTIPGSRQNIEIRAYGIQSGFLISSGETATKAEDVWQYLKK